MQERNDYTIEEDGIVSIGNKFMEVSIELSDELHLSKLVNKITGNTLDFSSSQMINLTLSCSSDTLYIPEWKFSPGSGECVNHENEKGYLSGFHKPGLDVSKWMTVCSLNEFPIGAVGHSTITYPGYGWYVCDVELGTNDTSLPLELHLGGCDNQDWLDYWVYLNGVLVGHASPSGYSHPAPIYIFKPGEPAYNAANFGRKNTIAVQARGLDRSFPGMRASDAERYSVGSLLAEQSVSIGPFSRNLSQFRFLGYSLFTHDDHTEAVFRMINDDEGIAVSAHFKINSGEAAITKKLIVKNLADTDQVMLELDLQRLDISCPTTTFGQGFPCHINDEVFCGVQHPAGTVQLFNNTLCLTTFPGRSLKKGEFYESKLAVFGVGEEHGAGRAFTDYLEKHGHRKRELLNFYHCYGIHDLAGLDEPTDLTEEALLANLDDLEVLRSKDVSFDYYFIDAGWSNPDGDLKDFDPRFFANGPGRIIERVKAMGMKLGLWTAPSSGPLAFHPDAKAPALAGCGTLPQSAEDTSVHRGALCMASEPWKSMYRDALMYHVRQYGASAFKLDGNSIQCSNPAHNHLPGKYSTESLMDATIEILEEIRKECPDVFIMYYWWIRSPWWLLWGNTIYERGVLMEGSTPSDTPTSHLRQSITTSFDQATHHAWDKVPIVCGDSLGVWISKWRWASYLGKEEWRDAWLMDIARGSMMCQLWGDLSMFNDEDREFLSSVSKWVKRKAHLLANPVPILGSPWDAEPYGYTYSGDAEAIAFIFNPAFGARDVSFTLNGCKVNAILKPFEVKVFEASGNKIEEFDPIRENKYSADGCQLPLNLVETECSGLSWDNPTDAHFLRRSINGRASYADLKDKFGPEDAQWADERDTEVVRRSMSGEVSIPSMQTRGVVLITCQTARTGVFWHHHALYDIVIPEISIDGTPVTMKSTPYRWHEEAGGWSWITFEGELNSGPARDASIQITTYLPRSVDVEVSAYLLDG